MPMQPDAWPLLLALTLALVALGVIVARRVRRSAKPEAYAASLRERLGPRDVLVSLGSTGRMTVCWWCGQDTQDRRELLLGRLVAPGVMIGEERVRLPDVPLCSSHGRPDPAGARMVRHLALPLGIAVILAVLIEAERNLVEVPRLLSVAKFAGLGLGAIVAWAAVKWADAHTPIRLRAGDPATGYVVLRLLDPKAVDRVRSESGKILGLDEQSPRKR